MERKALHTTNINELAADDERRCAWMNVDCLSSQWASAWPTHKHEILDLEMPEIMCSYMGLESPLIRPYEGGTIPIKERGGETTLAYCDKYGINRGRATLPGTENTTCHDNCGSELHDHVKEAGFFIQLGPDTLFENLIPVADIEARGMEAIVPDAILDMALPAVATGVRQKRGAPRPRRRLMADFKTIHKGTVSYKQRTSEQSGAVRAREAKVWPDYVKHARKIDSKLGAPGSKQIEQRLRSYTETRGVVFGAYGEASVDVHDIISTAADAIAKRQWRQAGACSLTEYRGFAIRNLRRRMGLTIAQEMARHTISRMPLINVPRQAVEDEMARRRRQRSTNHHAWAPTPEHFDFYAYQQIPIATMA